VATKPPRVARKTFSRKLPDDRRGNLIEATIESLKRSGHEGLAVRKIAAAAKVSIGLINHHFPRKDTLIAEAYRQFHSQLLGGIQFAVARAEDEPRARLTAFIEATFAPPNLDRDVLTAWLVFWSLYRHSRAIQRVHRETYRGHIELVRGLMAALPTRSGGAPALEPRLAAIGLTAMLDGLWVEWCLDPETFSPAEATQLCLRWCATS